MCKFGRARTRCIPNNKFKRYAYISNTRYILNRLLKKKKNFTFYIVRFYGENFIIIINLLNSEMTQLRNKYVNRPMTVINSIS